ncbi:MAG TPA: LLM class F420-dependent oxidoreductase [Myxococcota bacterium]|nr:LLM class F420-dependent oxidoreductase [Myxococcota bacterium]
MKFSIQLPTDRVEALADFGTADAIATLARKIEKSGFDACFVTEHPFPTDRWLASGGHHALDPFVSLAVAASATKHLRLHTNILVLAYRNPFLTAKAVASLDAVSGGRVIVGVGAGYLEGEFKALGASFEDRNDRSDDALVAMKAAWTGESVTMARPGFEAAGNTMLPSPVQRPHPPIWIGGNSPRAIRRAVDFAQGWSPFPLPAAGAGRTRTSAIESVADLAAGIRRMRDYAAERGREGPLDVNFVPFGLHMNTKRLPEDAKIHDQLGELAEAGVNWVTVGLPTSSRSAYLNALDHFAATFLPREGR